MEEAAHAILGKGKNKTLKRVQGDSSAQEDTLNCHSEGDNYFMPEESLTMGSFADGARIKRMRYRFHPLLAPAQDDVVICHSEGEARRISHNERGQEKIPSTFGRYQFEPQNAVMRVRLYASAKPLAGWHEVPGEGLKYNNQHPSQPSLIREGASYPNSGEGFRFAFTLAEVLITLGVIGVVAAMTIPGLMTAYKAHQLRSSFLKSYSVIQQVFKQMEADDVSTDPSTYQRDRGIPGFYKTFKNYLTGTIDCGDCLTAMVTKLPCYDIKNSSLAYKTYDNSKTISSSYFDDGQLALQDGTLFIFEQPKIANPYIWVIVDINGVQNKPNRLGYDLFVFEFLDGELRTMGDKETTYNNLDRYCNKNSKEKLNGIACAHYAKTESDYFKKIIKEFK